MSKNKALITVLVLCVSLVIYQLRAIITPFIIGLLCGYLLSPLMKKFKQTPKSLSAGVITLMFFAFLVMIIVIVLPIIYHQLVKLVAFLMQYDEPLRAQVLPKLLEQLEMIPISIKDKFEQNINGFANYALESCKNVFQYILQSGVTAISTISIIIISPIITFYVLKDWDILKYRIIDLIPLRYRIKVIEVTDELNSIIFSYLKGQVYVSLILITYYCISFKIVGIESAIALGFLSGLMIFIPYVGILVSSILTVCTTFIEFQSVSKVITVIIIFTIAQVCEGCFITPKLVGERVGLHPVWVIFGLLAGGVLFGFVGILVAIPLTAISQVFIRMAIIKYKNSQQYNAIEAIDKDDSR